MIFHTVLASLSIAVPAFAEPKIESVADQPYYTLEYDKATDFSGITWIKDDQFYVVTNRENVMIPLKLEIDRKTGHIRSHKFGSRIGLKSEYSDLEGIAWQPERERIYLSSESDHTIIGFDLEGDAKFRVTVPPVYKRAQQNRSLESLTFGAGSFWTSNEGTLEGDGKPSGILKGALVRIQKFDNRFKPLAQYAYRTDKSLVEGRTGVTDLCALPDGRLLVLERVMGAGLSAKIFRADFSKATDTSEIDKLSDADVNAADKTLLFDRATAVVNFEGIALGPELEGDLAGWRSIILVADNAGQHTHVFMPLRIKLDVEPEPKSGK